uniref:Exodeoxyribonuclease V alpha chain n=1 Tax=uncultured bacterium contig00021 TaxID=1181511 RepID=A0A806K2A4_9BACT|nr:exodeoxyribonuclease V alpha chain [uncultured bacterium contig00021]
MDAELSQIDIALLDFLENKYNVKKESLLYTYAKTLLQRLWQGSICIPVNEKIEDSGAVGFFVKGSDTIPATPLIYDGENLYIQRYFVYQHMILKKMGLLQKNHNLNIITGGPGTGKTTSLGETLAAKLKDNPDLKILLAAPTGKAAFRMNETLKKFNNLEAKTIHRLLGTIHLSANFRHTNANPLDANIIVIDECSMVDLPMMAKLLDAVPDINCHLYLLGDKNQLASVEAGSVFADICRKFENDDTVYKKRNVNFRTQDSPGIIELSDQILNNTIEDFNNKNVKHSEHFSFEELFDCYNGLLKAVDEKDALNKLKVFQILCAIKKGRNGTENINRELSYRAGKAQAKFTPIIITENNYEQNLFNGDVGVKDDDKAYFLNGTEVKIFPLLTLPGHDDAFAITIHKSQGSEYDRVAVMYPDTEQEDDGQTILTRELLYTAITRARKECIIYGNRDILLNSCKREIYRASGIK